MWMILSAGLFPGVMEDEAARVRAAIAIAAAKMKPLDPAPPFVRPAAGHWVFVPAPVPPRRYAPLAVYAPPAYAPLRSGGGSC